VEASGSAPAATAADAAGLPPGATAVTGQGGFTLEAAAAAWPAVVELVRAQNALVAAALAGTRPVAVSERDLTVAFPSGAEFLKRKAEQDEHRRVTADALRAATGHRLNLRYELGDAAPPVADTEPVMLSGEELVRRFLEEFDAEEILQDEHHEAEAKR
jgi:hypothetical protein